MADALADAGEPQPKRGKLPLLLGGVLALLLGAGGFYATWSGLILSGGAVPAERTVASTVAFVPLPPVMLTLPQEAGARFLRMTAQLEVERNHAEEVAALTPRLLDVLNGYLRAVDTRDLESPPALVRLRAQMLRRVQLVSGPGRVRDLLITEFVIN